MLISILLFFSRAWRQQNKSSDTKDDNNDDIERGETAQPSDDNHSFHSPVQ